MKQRPGTLEVRTRGRGLGVLIGPDLVVRDDRVIGVPEQRAKTDKSQSGWKKELKEAGPDAPRPEAVLARVQQIVKNT